MNLEYDPDKFEQKNFEGMSLPEKEKNNFIGIEIYLIRHAEQEQITDIDPSEKPVSNIGEKQITEFAEDFIRCHKDVQTVVKIQFSPVKRARETGELLTEKLNEIIKNNNLSNIKMYVPRSREKLDSAGIGVPLLEAGIPLNQLVDQWLEKYDQYKGIKTPPEVASNIRMMVETLDKLVKRLQIRQDRVEPSEKISKKIVYILITHDPSHGALMKDITGKTLDELGGGIKHMQGLKITLSGNPQSEPKVEFRDQKYILNTKNE